MIVEPSHRASTGVYDRQTYDALCSRIVDALGAIEAVRSVVICGSLIKDTLVPGWSDLDIVTFVADDCWTVPFLHDLKQAMNLSGSDIQIGVGLDVVNISQFRKTKRLGGRPLAMSYEVAGYGVVRYGINPFEELTMDGVDFDLIEYDRQQAMKAEMHNWIRAFILERGGNVAWIARCVKTSLKLLKHITDPNMTGPYTYEAAYQKAIARNVAETKLRLFETAVRARENWTSLMSQEEALAGVQDRLESGLTAFARN